MFVWISSRCAFITFNEMDDADKAVDAMNGTMVKGRTLRVHLARKQPSLEAVQNNTNSPWTKLGAYHCGWFGGCVAKVRTLNLQVPQISIRFCSADAFWNKKNTLEVLELKGEVQ